MKKRFVTSIDEVKRIGVIYPFDVETDKEIRRFAKELESLGPAVSTLGFVDEKELDGHYSPNLKMDYFCLKDVNRLKLPVKSHVMRFISEPFDYLIVSTTEVSEPLLGIAALSKANLRIGKYLKEYDFCYDMMIKGDHPTLKALNEEIVRYIKSFGNG